MRQLHCSVTKLSRYFAPGHSFVWVLLSIGRNNEREETERYGAAPLAIIASSANSLVRFKGGRYAFAEARRAARRNGNIFAAITMPLANLLS